jgi:putative peptide zinc metalloprotease protein
MASEDAQTAVRVSPVPRLGEGLTLYGEYQGGGFTRPRYLARRGDGQVVQLTYLLYLVASAIDGGRDVGAVARRVSAWYGREVSAGNIDYLIDTRLQPMGIAVLPGPAGEADPPRSDLLLGLTGQRTLLTARQVGWIARSLSWLHYPPLVVAVLAGGVGLDVWLFGYYGALGPVLHVLDRPVLLLAVFALTVASLVFHEFGHASACHYGGAKPGRIGCGLYVLWPSLFTDVTDVYRIGRVGRLRADLGGVYFNVVFILALGGGYLLTGRRFLLAAILVAHIEIAEQLLPAVRLDGYFILGDLAGVPDLFGKIGPILLSMLPGRAAGPEVADLKRSARIVVTGWVVTMVPLLLAEFGYLLWNLPRIMDTAGRSLIVQSRLTLTAFADGRIPEGIAGVVGSLLLLCPAAGAAWLVARVAGRLVRRYGRAAAGRHRHRRSVPPSLASATVAAEAPTSPPRRSP